LGGGILKTVCSGEREDNEKKKGSLEEKLAAKRQTVRGIGKGNVSGVKGEEVGMKN